MLLWGAWRLCVDWAAFAWPALGLKSPAAASAACVWPDAARAAVRAGATLTAEAEQGAAAGAGRPAGPAATEPALTAAETAALAAACSAETALTKPSVAVAGGSTEGAVGI